MQAGSASLTSSITISHYVLDSLSKLLILPWLATIKRYNGFWHFIPAGCSWVAILEYLNYWIYSKLQQFASIQNKPRVAFAAPTVMPPRGLAREPPPRVMVPVRCHCMLASVVSSPSIWEAATGLWGQSRYWDPLGAIVDITIDVQGKVLLVRLMVVAAVY